MGELAPGECITNALPGDNGMSVAWALNLRCVWDALLGWLAEQAKEGGEATVKEENEEEDWRRRSSTASGVMPLQVPELVEGGPVWPRLFSGQSA